jgi:hypothetical protein
MFNCHTMKKLILLLIIPGFCIMASAQKVYSVEYPNQADVKVFVVRYENQMVCHRRNLCRRGQLQAD